MNQIKTTILGVEYPGRPAFGTLAMQIYLLEEKSGTAKAQALLDAHNQMLRAFKRPPVDLTADMTLIPEQGLTIAKAR